MGTLELPAHVGGHPCLRSTPGDPNTRYPVADFLDDQRRVAAAAKHLDLAERDTVSTIDGCMRIVHAGVLREALDSPSVKRAFARKYPGPAAAGRLRRFALVVDFLYDRGAEIVRCGVGEAESSSLSVRDELLDFLLDCRVDPKTDRLPPQALERFVDEWGHRWF